ncbi:MAG: glutamate-5-semialdehyde dehydrogenase [Phycisphaerae bacterium]|nr:glutamate-5-semialdehyde dehydrogenase [Phycisphaerae bacterium]NIV14053.1 glutamate-5-semialdehyde dehydrogenase [Fodinibius sp.]NIW92607.1 glutamate-5-semialdehyde dehydrogenase [Phycisphaerae bacterium]
MQNTKPIIATKTIAQTAKETSGIIALAGAEQKNAAIQFMTEKLVSRKRDIIAANLADVAEATGKGLPTNMIDRLSFSEIKIEARVRALQKVKALPDPVGQAYNLKHLPNGLDVMRMRVPLGVVLMIYEARPHVTVNAGALCLKSGNSAILRGGSEARRCNELLGVLWQESLTAVGLPRESIQVVSGSHDEIKALLQESEFIDLVIPRGGKTLIQAVIESSKIPVIKHYSGICHVYIDCFADIDKAIDISLDSKCLMPEVCNAMETLLVCKDLSSQVPKFVDAFKRCGVKVRGCRKIRNLIPNIESSTEEDWRTEYLDNIVSMRIVTDVEEAIEHINSYGSHHTDAIVTNNVENADKFSQRVSSAVVLWNASTMFCDGESLGMGAEIGISTDKLHARGPMGLEELTSYKLFIRGDGHIMGDPHTYIKKAEKY